MNNIILTSYNRTMLLGQAIESALLQCDRLFIIDDGSPQPTRDVINGYTSNEKVIYIQTDKKDADRRKFCDYSVNINTCLRQITDPEDYVYYLACDDYFLPNHVPLLSKALDEHKEWKMVFGQQKVTQYNDKNHTEVFKFDRVYLTEIKSASCVIDHIQVGHRRSLNDDVGFWPEEACHYGAGDAAFWTLVNRKYSFYPATSEITNVNRHHKQSVQGIG